MKHLRKTKSITITTICYMVAIAGTLLWANACKKSHTVTDTGLQSAATKAAIKNTPQAQHAAQVQNVTIANIRLSGDGKSTKVMFNQLEEIFTVSDDAMIATLKSALAAGGTVRISFDPWKASIASVTNVSAAGNTVKAAARGVAYPVDLNTMSVESINNMTASAMINTTADSLTNVIPDMATAQMMFDFITYQACALPGPYGIDQCISFQYCEDGCYARAHKMCWIINHKYHYNTHKIFSFANAGHDELCVQGEKWGGCCVNWWYHVAPIVNIKTPSGPKAYVFDPAMFDQPVLLATWLHAQENPACVPSGDVPHVTMINLQPTASYTPADGTGYHFDTDPLYVSTNSTMSGYSSLLTCP